MARTALTVNTINNGTTGSLVEVTAALGAANVDGHSFTNGSDRRTFLIIKNASGATRTIDFPMPVTMDGAAGDAIQFRDTVSPANFGDFRVELGNGETRMYGPFRENIFNQSDDTVHVDFDSVTSVTVAAFKLPRVVSNTYQGLHRTDTGTTPGSVDTLTVQNITPDGLSPTFDEHDQANGWLCPLHRAQRRLLWIKNTSGGNITFVAGNTAFDSPVTDAATATMEFTWRSDSIANNEEWLLGPWDRINWDYGNGNLWVFGQSGPHTNFDAAWLELSP